MFTAPATTEIYTLSLHDALPILPRSKTCPFRRNTSWRESRPVGIHGNWRSVLTDASCSCPSVCRIASSDRKSTRLNSSHPSISYAVFCLKKKNKKLDVVRYLVSV